MLNNKILKYGVEYWLVAIIVLTTLYFIFGYVTFIVTFIVVTLYFYYTLLNPKQNIRIIDHIEAQIDIDEPLQLPHRPNLIKVFKGTPLVRVFFDDTYQDFILNNLHKDFIGKLPIVYGYTTDNKLVMSDLLQAPSLLIAGVSGSGKSTLIHQIITVLLATFKSNNLELYLVDTKRVELSRYANFPHTKKIVYDHDDIGDFLLILKRLINDRYMTFQEMGINSIQEYNGQVHKYGFDFMPFIVVVIEELGDLMLDSDKAIKVELVKILQKGRAAGVHIIALTQRPSSTIIDSSIKANMPSRVSLRVSSATDSRIILDRTGAELLVDKGEMIVLDGGNIYNARSLLVTKEEIDKLRKAWQ
jgi:DNA segregation ATPase FtsK/SpoIIIE-like protein